MTKMLDILEDYLELRKWKTHRIDGMVHWKERQVCVCVCVWQAVGSVGGIWECGRVGRDELRTLGSMVLGVVVDQRLHAHTHVF